MMQNKMTTAEVVTDYSHFVAGGFGPLPVSQDQASQ
jgi:hypothetical protein